MTEVNQRPLDPKLGSLLSDLRQRIRRYITIDSLLAVVAVLTVTFWLGLLLDWGPVRLGGTEMPRSARAVLLGIAGLALGYVAIRIFGSRISAKLPDDSLALLLERQHPELAGRLITAVQLNRPRQTGDVYSSHLLQRVYAEALVASEKVDVRKVFRWQPITSKLWVVCPLVLALILLAIASPETVKQAAERLFLISDAPWPRKADLRMVGIEVPRVSALEQSSGETVRMLEFDNRVVQVAKGGAATLRIEAVAEGAIVPEVCTVYYRTSGGLRGQVNMRRVGRVREGIQAFALDGPPLAGITEDIELDIRGLDDRLDGYRIVAVDPPNITSLEVEAKYPPYLRSEGVGDAPDLVSTYQPGLRLREGTSVRLIGHSINPIVSVESAITEGDQPTEVVQVDVQEDGHTFAISIPDVRQPISVVIVPMDENEITAPSPYRYFLGVISDSPPNVQLRLLGIGNLVTPQVRIPFSGKASDDYGVEELRIQLAPVGESVEPVASMQVTTDRDRVFKGVIDVRDLTDQSKLPVPEPGAVFNIYGEARDGYSLGPPHLTRTDLLRLEVVTAEDLLAALERRELGLRSRLEQTISEMRNLRESLDLLRREGWPTTPTGPAESSSTAITLVRQNANVTAQERPDQWLELKIQQAGLQTTKSAEELRGIATSIDDILMEMVNNRVDSPDRSERIASGVRDPLQMIVEGDLAELRQQIDGLIPLIDKPKAGRISAGGAVQAAERVLLALESVLEKMLDLESYNEVLDLVRGLIDQQGELIEATEEQRKKALQDLFRGFE